MQKQKVLHYPRLDTIQMVEDTIKNAPHYLNKRQLWLALPKKVMYQTLLVILDYLEENHRIRYDKDGTMFWTWDPEGIKKALASNVRVFWADEASASRSPTKKRITRLKN